MKSESLNLLEPSGSFQTCTGIALPSPLELGNKNLFLVIQNIGETLTPPPANPGYA